MGWAVNGKENFLLNDPTWAKDFAPDGTLVQLNDTIYRKRYADTLETISRFGVDAFYTGAMADATIAAIQGTNGTMVLDDLKNYTVALRRPAQIDYKGFKITACSAPSGGTVALSVMKIVEGYDAFGEHHALNLSTHRIDEAMRFAYGEVSAINLPSTQHTTDLTRKSAFESRRSLLCCRLTEL